MRLAKETIWFTTKTLSFAVLVLLILFTVVTITGSALPDNVGSGQLDSESPAVYALDTSTSRSCGGYMLAVLGGIGRAAAVMEGDSLTKKEV
ncbi:MAG: hypothetical protein K8R34_06945 [Methanosarcinales archaeon]|nr:hypothetical protein [Methanosarcinales archaeon]